MDLGFCAKALNEFIINAKITMYRFTLDIMLTKKELRTRNGISVDPKLLVEETGVMVFTNKNSDIGPNKIQLRLSV